MVERRNREVNRHLRDEMYQRQSKAWLSVLPTVQNIINQARATATSTSPWKLMVSRDQRGQDGSNLRGREDMTKVEQMVRGERERDTERKNAARKAYDDAKKKQEGHAKKTPTRVCVKAWVYVDRDAETREKYQLRWRGPLQVVKKAKTNQNSFVVRDPETNKTYVKHVAHLKLAEGEWDEEKAKIECAKDRMHTYIKEIVTHKVKKDVMRTPLVKCRWLGYEPSDDTWRDPTDEDMKSNVPLMQYRQLHPDLDEAISNYTDLKARLTSQSKDNQN
ncbi:Chromo (CHRromatin Organization MOdifier) domain [Carpediemonas membranifera]|uniref:Chromo (CHRromatin Organization MOdifier) domain n=1 Tax=Carpediemonas membranifera TaxID=201153 RepID=A0A8J6B8F4_9EUKA|nr:Chromo (CHRromatin Organization MOdifier) domain [Carpediemonas membranifera]|eukprot:KAG9395324.1 Chromo (CHRromatin Organization MOdifier) domain [Carpediemonas membranifera]